METSANFLLSRKKLLLFSLLDFLIIIFSLNFLYSFLKINFIFLCVIAFFWILISYIFGRYEIYKLFSIINLVTEFFKIFFISLFFYILNIFLLNPTINNLNFNNLKHFNSVFFLSIVISFLSNIAIRYFFKEENKENQNWLLIASKTNKKLFLNLLKESNRDINHLISNKNINEIKNHKKFSGLIIEDLNNLKKTEIKKISILKSKGLKIFELIEWCQIYLEILPAELIDNKYLIKKEFRIIRPSLHSRIKRVCDVIVGLIILFLSSPIILIASLIIYLEDRGPILFYQKRVGFNGKEIRIWKLRSMRVDAEKIGLKWTNNNDTRITKFGKLIRKFRIDELPQICSVISGEMSLIGPRPREINSEKEYENSIINYSFRYKMKPGISGWAQVNYPQVISVNDAKKTLAYDIYYILNFSIFLDLLIFFKTMQIVFTAKQKN